MNPSAYPKCFQECEQGGWYGLWFVVVFPLGKEASRHPLPFYRPTPNLLLEIGTGSSALSFPLEKTHSETLGDQSMQYTMQWKISIGLISY